MFERDRKRPYTIAWGIATALLYVALISIVVAIALRFLLFVVPVAWKFWHGLIDILHFIAIWVFRITLPAIIVVSIIAFVWGLIWHLTKDDGQ